MKLAFATTFDSRDIRNWSGTPFHMASAFEDNGFEVNRIDNLKRRLPPFFKLKQFWKKLAGQRESPRFNIVAAKYYSEQVAQRLEQLNVDAIISPLTNPIAYLDSNKPIILWTDALYASLVGFYPVFNNHSASSIAHGNAMMHECLARCKLAIFSSDWAARGAMEFYGASKEKVKVVPYGANFQCQHHYDDIRAMLNTRSRDTVKLLFVGKQWYRKGGDIVFKVAKALHASGQKVELNFVGCLPPTTESIPSYIKCHGFISKATPEGLAKMTRLFQESHFLFLPSRAEACAISFCEANAFGLPVLTSYVGGIATVVKDNINGMTFGLDASTEVYCEYISRMMRQYTRYEDLALSAFNEYKTRLNWDVAVREVKKLILEC
ncbi:MAG: glycosyltransferase family 4 protein [Gammaproteobacteria bacterium]